MNKIRTIIVTCLLLGIAAFSFRAANERTEYNAATLSEEARFQARCYGAEKYVGQGETYATNVLIQNYKNGNTDIIDAINYLISEGEMSQASIELVVAAGIPIKSNSSAINDSNATPSAVVPAPSTKTEFTVEDVTPYPAWATKDCNIRSGADTSYDKAGSLKKYEQITVTGKASTGWFRIKTADGKEAYISDTLITTEDPSNREYTTVDNSGDVTTYTFEDTPPEVIDEIIEGIEEKTEEEQPHEHSYNSEITKVATCTEPGEITYTCVDGDDTYVETIPTLEHEVGDWTTVKEPTLVSAGLKVKTCKVCGATIEEEAIPAKTSLFIGIICACVVVVIGAIAGVVIRVKK